MVKGCIPYGVKFGTYIFVRNPEINVMGVVVKHSVGVNPMQVHADRTIEYQIACATLGPIGSL